MKDLPRFEPLEDRIVLDGEAQVTVDGPSDVQLGAQNVDFTLTFDNVNPTDTGYVPFIDVILPTLGPDGDDGVSFDSASFLGGPVTTTQLVFDVNGEAFHPVAVDSLGDPLVVTGTPGETLLVFELPYGSFSPGNPPVDVVLTLDFSDQADLSTDFELLTRGGFALGNDPLDNPATDPSTVSAFTTTTVDQTLFELTKANNAPENEAATGPSYTYTYTLGVDVAPGQTLTDFNLVDTLPPEIVYLGNLSVSPAGTVNTEPTAGLPAGPGNNTLDITFASITGAATVTFDYYIDEAAAGAAGPILSETTGDPAPVTNSVTGTGTWDPLDSDDPIEPISATSTDQIEAVSLAVQKSAAVIDDTNLPGVISPGDVYQFTLNVQVSDYFTFGDLEITDVLGNGWEYVNAPGFAPVLTTTESSGGAVTAVNLTTNESTSFNGANGETTIVWDISQALVDAGSDGILTGDDADGAPGGGSTTATITYFARVLDDLTDDGSIGEIPFTQGDLLSNAAEISATVRENGNPGNVVGVETDDTGVSLQTPFGQIDSKTVAFVNGAPPNPTLPIAAGDEVTFSVIYTAPLGSFEDLQIIDNLPQNVFDATEITTFSNTVSATPPAAGTAQFGLASADYVAAGGGVPSINVVANDNQIDYDFGTFTAVPRETVQIEILFTVTVIDSIFADGLLLTNQATAIEDNVVNGTVDSTAIANFVYSQPELEITKGVIASDPTATFDAAQGPATFTAPGSAGPRFTDVGGNPITISSDTLDTTPIDANISNIDAGDLVSFAIVVENTGSAPNGAFDVTVTDTLPPGFVVPAGGLNLTVTDGTGTRVIGFTGDLFAGGIVLDDRGAEGSLSGFDATSGENLVVITYDLEAVQAVTPGDIIENTATVTNFTAFESGPGNTAINRATPDLTDDATASVQNVSVSKTLVDREFGEQGATEVLVGEEFTFEVRVNLPEGDYENAVISDVVRTGGSFGDYEILSAVITGWDTGVLSSSTGVTLNSTGVVAGDGNSVSFALGDVSNLANNNASDDFITFEVTARSLGSQSEDAGDRLANTASFAADGVAASASNGVNLIEPQLTIDKSATPAIVQAGDTVTYTIVVENPIAANDAPAFDLELTDLLDANVDLVAGSVVVTGGTGVTVVTGNGGGDTSILVTADRLGVTETLTITYSAIVDPAVEAGIVIDNTADLTFDSLPTDNADDERDYSISDDADVTTAAAGITKEIAQTSNPDTAGGNLSIGEIVTYDITIVLPEGTNSNAVLTDFLPTTPGVLTPISATLVSIGSNITGSALTAGTTVPVSGSDFVFNFGTLENANDLTQDARDEIVVRVVAQLDDVAANAAGDTLVNTATFSTDNTSVSDTATVNVVEPVLGIDKVADVTEADAGDTVTYTITSTNTGGAPAYDIVIEDAVGDPALAAGSPPVVSIAILGGTAPTGPDAPSVTYTASGIQGVIPVLLPGQTIQITYEAVVVDAAAFATSIDNTAEVTRYDSDPAGDTTDPDDGRVYTGPTDSVSLDTPDPSVDKTLIGSDNPDTTGATLAISEIGIYQITITLPEGTSDLRLEDDLPPGLTPISAELTTFDASMTSDNLVQGDTDTTSGFITTGALGGFVFDFGTVVNAGDNNNANDTIVITVTAQVADIAAVQSGGSFLNVARLSLIDPVSGGILIDPDTGRPQTYIDTATVSVAEPELDIDKSVVPAVADAGDTVTYTIVSENVGAGPAYDIVLNDPLDNAGLDIPTPAVGTIRILDAGNADVTPGGADAPALVYPTGTDGLQATIPVLLPGQRIEIVFEAVIADSLTFSTVVENTAEVTRFDSDPDGDTTDPDDGRVYDSTLPGYTVPEDNAVVTSPDVTLAKTVLSTNDPGTTGTDVGIGETVTFQLTLTLPEGTADLTLTDTLPAGLSPVSAEVISLGSTGNVSTANIAAGATDASSFVTLGANSVTFDFGTVTVDPSNDAAATDETIVVEVTARVLDVASNTQGTDLINQARLDVDDPTTGAPLQPDPTATAEVDVVEPDLDISKTGPAAANPGDTVPYVVTVTNAGAGPAYDIVFEDLMTNPELALTGTPVFSIDGTPITPPVTLVGDGFTAVIGTLAPGETLTVTYDAILSLTAPDAQSFLNTATVNYDTIDDGDPNTPDARTYTDSDDHAVATVPVLVKEATGSSLTQTGTGEFDGTDVDLVVGEEVTYTLTLVLPEVAMDSVVLVDTLPVGLEFVSAAFVSEGAQISGAAGVSITNVGQITTFDFGTVDNTSDLLLDAGDEVTVSLTARVVDVAAATEGASLVNSSTLNVTATGGVVLDPTTDTAAVDIVEPALDIEKSGPLAADAGDRITYTIEIENTGTGPAFDVLVADALGDPNLTLVSGSIGVTLNSAPLAVTATEAAGGFSLTAPQLLPGDVLLVSFQADVGAGFVAGDTLVNTATADFDTIPDGTPNSPTGRTDDVTDDHTVQSGPLLDKTVVSTSLSQTGDGAFAAGTPDLVVGETVTYALTVTLPEFAIDGAVLVDTLPAGLSFVSASVDSIGAGLVGATPSISNSGQTVTIEFGAITNPVDGSLGADDQVVILVTALVEDVASNADGASLSNTASLTLTPAGQGPLGPVTDAAEVDIVEPALDVVKDGDIAVNPGSNVNYTVTLTNTGTGPAFDVLVADTLGDPFLSFNAGSVAVTLDGADITASLTVVTTATGFELIAPQILPGQTLVVAYSALLDPAAPEAQSFPNTADVTFDTVPDGDPNSPTGRTDTETDDFSVATVPFIVKTPIATSFSETGSSVGDAGLFDLTVGEVVTYQYDVFLPEIAMDSVVLDDVLGPELELVSVNVVSYGAGITATNTTPVIVSSSPQAFTIDFGAVVNPADGSIGADDVIRIEVQARVLDVPTAVSGRVTDNTVTTIVDPAGPTPPLAPSTDTAQIEIVDPNLTIDKVGPVGVNPGDTATYTVTLENTGDGPAFDVLIADTLGDPNLSLVPGSVTLTLAGAPITPTVTATASGFEVLVPVIAPGEVLVVSYDATLSASAPAAQSFDNTVTAVFDTVPDGDPNSPTGRTETVTDDATIVTSPGLDKAVVSTSNADTGTGQGDGTLSDLSVGEQVTYNLTLTLPEADLDSIVLTDTLPAGLSFVSASVLSVGADISLAGPAAISNVGALTTFDLGASTALGDGTINTEDQIVIEVVAVVADVAAATDGAVLTNTSELNVTPTGGAPFAPQTDTASVEVVEPALTLDKSGPIAANPGETLPYTITLENTGTGPAYDILVADLLGDPNLSLVGVTGATINGTSILGALTITPTAAGFETLVDALLPGETLVISYDVLLSGAAPNAQSFPNTATVEFDTIPDGNPATPGGRPDTDSDAHVVATVPAVNKDVAFTSQSQTGTGAFDPANTDLSIGEEVTYTLEIILPELLLDSVVLTDTLPAGLSFVSASVSNVGSSIVGAGSPTITNVGQLVTFDFGAVDNVANASLGPDDRIFVEVTAVVTTAAGNTAGTVLTNDARLNVDPNGAPAFNELTATADVEIVEPQIAFDKTGPLAANPGDTVPYTLTLENTGTGPAFDLAVSDTVSDPNLTYVPGSVTVTIGGVPQTLSVDETNGFRVILPQLLVGETAEVTFEAVLSASVAAATTVPNTAEVTFDTVPNGDPNSPTGRPTTETDDHGVATIPTLTKTAISSDNPDTGTGEFDPSLIDLTVGEEVTYELVLTLPEIAMDQVLLTDTLPTGMAFVSASVTSTGAGITVGAPTVTQVGQVVSIDLGAVTNPFDGSIGADDEIRIEIVAVVTDDPAVSAGVQLTNTGALTITPQGGTPLDPQTDTAVVEVVEPLLSIDKTVNIIDPTVGDTITYTVTVTNDASATAPIYNSVVSDPLPFQLSTTGGITVSDPGLATVTSGSVAGDTTLAISIPRLAPGESVTITYDVFVGFQTNVLVGVTNVATVEGTSTPDPVDPFNRTSTVSDPAQIIAQPIGDNRRDADPFRSLGIDDAHFLPVLAIDPIYSGTAEPGSNVTIRLYGPQGELTGVRNVLADAGGHWIAIFPRVDLDTPYDDFFSELQGSRVFDMPIEFLDQQPITEIGALSQSRFADIGTDLGTESYGISLSVDRPSTLPQDSGMFNARTFYASAFQQEAFSVSDTLRVDEVFENIAAVTVQDLYEGSLNPLGQSLNRFNHEFLSSATATPGSPY